MNKLYAKIAATAASVVLMGGMFASSVLADEVITGNGAGSTNTITVTDVSTCNVSQSSTTSVGAIVGSSASTGGNTANGNTGGNVSITTGDATATSIVTVTGGSNTATNPCCCPTPCVEGGCCQGQVSGQSVGGALIGGNGALSHNTVTSTVVKTTDVTQKSKTKVRALVTSKAKTGKNTANGNTGGTVDVKTGASDASSSLDVTGGSNTI